MSKAKYDVLILELIPESRIGSGFEREDTVNLPEDQKVRIIHPRNRVILNTSVIKQESTENPGTMINVVTRSIYGQQEIIKTNQEKANMTTSNRDKIVFINGFRMVPNDGAFVGEYKWAKSHAQNESNPDRPLNSAGNPLLQPVFREVKPEKTAQDKNIYDLQLAQALGFINKELVTVKGEGYEYKEEAIDTVAANFGISADSPAQKVSALIAFAKAKPGTFIELAKNSEQTVNIEIKHAVQLKLIACEGNMVKYTEGENPVIKTYSNVQNTDESKLSALGKYFQKVEGKEAYELFKQRLEAAKVAVV